MAVLPRPVGELASKPVSIHGDLWEGNTVLADDGALRLVDFELSCVCGAVYDLVHTCGPALVEAYLRQVTGRWPTEKVKFTGLTQNLQVDPAV
jgi:Ser/Thr protein kinase RdoA (MazF antagonist)